MRISAEDRAKVAAGKVVYIGGYSASSEEDLERIARKLAAIEESEGDEREFGDPDPDEKLPSASALSRLGIEKVREQALKEGVTVSEDADKAAIVKAIMENRPAE